MKKRLCLSLLALVGLSAFAYQAPVSVAGLFPMDDAGRRVYDFNQGWRYFKGEVESGESLSLDDSAWEVVCVPHTVQLLPAEGSGSRNYQGVAWYRKRFVVDADCRHCLIDVYFEAVMGRSRVFVNGRPALEHLGGYLPFCVRLNDFGVQAGDTCLIAVCTDNSDDKSFPPGKKQSTLDFTYHGGIYRDVWLIAKDAVHITDPVVERHQCAGGGVFLHYDKISDKSATVYVDTELGNNGPSSRSVVLEAQLCDGEGKVIKKTQTKVNLAAGAYRTVNQRFEVAKPRLWSPEDPYLYQVKLRVLQGRKVLDGGMVRAGIRLAEFRGKDGFWLNGKPYHQLIGTNRHQDFAYVGNALPNSQHWKDAKILREGGCTIVRSAHYPQDPAWMDACDELGIFMIVPTPGWQFWNKDPQFAEYVLDDVTQMIRRDRNHCSVLLWEPILNETPFPEDFSLNALQITRTEFPYEGAPLSAADKNSKGVAENYGVVYGWPKDVNSVEQCIFTREFGENVDDWYAQNNNNRASRSWGEVPLLGQALSLAQSYGEMFQGRRQFIGGAQWHSFDHQRGYHPDPYWGGQTDAFRQPKYAYYMFKSQVPADFRHPLLESGPMVFVAHEMGAYSPNDVVVFSNCDSVRLIVCGRDTMVQAVPHDENFLPNGPVTFENAWDFWKMRDISYFQKNWQGVTFDVEGLIGGKVVCSTRKMPSRRSTKLSLRVENAGQPLTADGSDFAVVICEVTDDNGNVRRLAKDNILFTVEGEGTIVGDASIGANPRAVEFGSAPLLVRSTTRPGKIRVKAEIYLSGLVTPTPAEIEFESVPARYPFCYIDEPGQGGTASAAPLESKRQMSSEDMNRMLEEVVQQQADFGEGRKE